MHRSRLGSNDLVSTLKQGAFSFIGETGSQIVFRSNVTPDITIDISGLMKAKSGQPVSEEVPVSSDDKTVLRLVRPEVTLRGLGVQSTYAPYGQPRKEFALALFAGIIVAGLIGARLAWVICKKI